MRIPLAIAIGAITAVLLSGGGVAASAATPSDAPAADRTHAVAASGPNAEATAELAELERHAGGLSSADHTAADGIRTFDYAAAVTAGVPDEMAANYARGVTGSGGVVVNAPAGVITRTDLRAACRGQNKVWVDFATHIRINSCVTPKVVAALGVPGGLATVAGLVGGFAGAGFAGGGVAIAGAIFSYSSWSIDQCSKNGSGVELLFAGFVCWAQ